MTTEVATFVFADLAGYTAMTEAHGDEQAADTAAAFAALVREIMGDYGAEQVKSIGDALLLRVPDAADAIHLSARLVGDHGARHRSLGVRVGMHTGVAVCRDGDWYGAVVNVAARVADLARAGEVLLTTDSRAAAGDAVLPGQLRSRGRRHLKNVRERVEILALTPEDAAARALPVDPVCRMAVDPALAEVRIVHRGSEYHFCSAGCATAFREAPERYVGSNSRRTDLLVSDRARDTAARSVARAYARGRLTAEELEERSEQVWAARTRGDLSAATHGLRRPLRRPSPLLWPFWPFIWAAARLRAAARRRQLGRGD